MVLNSGGSLCIEESQICDMVRQCKLRVLAFEMVNLVFPLDVLLILGEDANAGIGDKDGATGDDGLSDAGIFIRPLSLIGSEIQLCRGG